MYLHIGIGVCSDTHHSKNSSSLHTTYRSLLFHNHRLAKTDFHTRCKHASEPETSSSLSHARASRNPLLSKRTSTSKGNEDFDQKSLTLWVSVRMYFQEVWSTSCPTIHICSIFGYEKLKALLYIRLLFLQCPAWKTKLMQPKELRKMGQKANIFNLKFPRHSDQQTCLATSNKRELNQEQQKIV